MPPERWVTTALAAGVVLVAAFYIYRQGAWRRYGAFEYALVCYVLTGFVLTQILVLNRFSLQWQEYAQPVALAISGALLAGAMSLHAIATLYARTRPNHWLVPVTLTLVGVYTALSWVRNQWRATGGYLDAETRAGNVIWLVMILVAVWGLSSLWAAWQKRRWRDL